MLTFRLIGVVVVACLLPLLVQLAGFSFDTARYTLDLDDPPTTQSELSVVALFIVRGEIIHTIIEWTAVCLAVLTSVLSLVHYFLKRDVTTPVIATSFAFAALLDGFRILIIDHVLFDLPDPEAFSKITWALSRVFLITMLITGLVPFLLRGETKQRVARDLRDFLLLSIAYSLAAFVIMYYATQILVFNDAEAVSTELANQLNFLALLLFSIGGGVVLTLYNSRYGGIFATSLVASLIPHSIAQLYATFESTALYDAGFNLASVYKVIGLLVPAVGLMFDYRRASQADAELASTARQLDIARDIQNSLLPQSKPSVGFVDVAGLSVASEAVGGDYYDHIELPDGSLLLVVADVSGHDLGAALLMANARAYLKAWTEDESDIAVILESLNRFVASDARGRRFITGMLVRVPAAGPISFVCGGHTGYIVDADGRHRILEQKNVPLGVFDELKTTASTTTLDDSETLVMLTDGLVEIPNKKGEQFGLDRIAAVVGENSAKTADESLDKVREAAKHWAGPVAPFDDMTVVLLRRTQTKT